MDTTRTCTIKKAMFQVPKSITSNWIKITARSPPSYVKQTPFSPHKKRCRKRQYNSQHVLLLSRNTHSPETFANHKTNWRKSAQNCATRRRCIYELGVRTKSQTVFYAKTEKSLDEILVRQKTLSNFLC